MTEDPVPPDPKVMFRTALLHHRTSLTPPEVAVASGRICRSVARHPLFREARVTGFYQAVRNEADPSFLIHLAQRLGKEILLPVVRAGAMFLAPHPPGGALVRGPMGILEPRRPDRLWDGAETIGRVDLLFLPLVGFDISGGRLGYGGGFYDRFLAPLRAARLADGNPDAASPRPALVGLAFAAQEVPAWLRAMHDVPLDFVATEHGFFPIRVFPPGP